MILGNGKLYSFSNDRWIGNSPNISTRVIMVEYAVIHEEDYND